MITLRYALKDAKIQIADEASFKSGDTTLPAGTFIVPAVDASQHSNRSPPS